MTEAAPSFRVGIDENGLGPRLGPLVVTAVMARLAPGSEGQLERWRTRRSDRLGDSKGLVAHGDVALGEAWTRALLERGAGNSHEPPTTPDAMLHALALDSRSELYAPCPPHVKAQCWSAEHDERLLRPSGGPGDEHGSRRDELRALVRADLAQLAQRGVDVVAARSVLVCTKRLNDGMRAGLSRLRADLLAMERLILAMRELAGAELSVVCGKVGGYREYRPVLGPLGDRLCTVVQEERPLSCYRFAGVGLVSFAQDADETDPLVGLASLVGKYLRELTMNRIVHYYRVRAPELPDASGYNDPVTDRFVRDTERLRADAAVPADCFERLRTSKQR